MVTPASSVGALTLLAVQPEVVAVHSVVACERGAARIHALIAQQCAVGLAHGGQGDDVDVGYVPLLVVAVGVSGAQLVVVDLVMMAPAAFLEAC